MVEPKIVTMHNEEITVVKRFGEIILARRIGLPCDGFDRANAKLLHEALGRALNTGEG